MRPGGRAGAGINSLKLDGAQLAANSMNRKRTAFCTAFDPALELNLLTANRLSKVKWALPKNVRAIGVNGQFVLALAQIP